LIGSVRRDCPDHVIVLSERHLSAPPFPATSIITMTFQVAVISKNKNAKASAAANRNETAPLDKEFSTSYFAAASCSVSHLRMSSRRISPRSSPFLTTGNWLTAPGERL
jgi:hypothetical protein